MTKDRQSGQAENGRAAVGAMAQQLLAMGGNEMTPHERRVVQHMAKRLVVLPPPEGAGDHLTAGERMADRVAAFGGSWTFLAIFSAVLLFWVALNSIMLTRPFDPYPYILLNLFLSMLASVQAPIIMMSQNRQAAKDRLQAAHDYEVNLKAEIDILALHEKLDEIRHTDLAALLKHLEQGNAPNR